MHSVCCCSLLVWRKSFLKKGTPLTYFCPALDPPLDGSGQKTTTLVRDLEYFIHTKFHQNPSSGSGEEVENVNSLTDDGRTDAGQRVITIGHWSLWLLCPKNISVNTIFSLVAKFSYIVTWQNPIFKFWLAAWIELYLNDSVLPFAVSIFISTFLKSSRRWKSSFTSLHATAIWNLTIK